MREKPEDLTLTNAILKLRTKGEVMRFLRDLCTPSEIRAIEERWLIACLLDMEAFSYREIAAQTGISLTTITRVARFLNDERYKGYRLLLDRLKGK